MEGEESLTVEERLGKQRYKLTLTEQIYDSFSLVTDRQMFTFDISHTHTLRWYLGEVTQDAAESLLTSSNLPNTFVVYNASDTGQYILSARYNIILIRCCIGIDSLMGHTKYF